MLFKWKMPGDVGIQPLQSGNRGQLSKGAFPAENVQVRAAQLAFFGGEGKVVLSMHRRQKPSGLIVTFQPLADRLGLRVVELAMSEYRASVRTGKESSDARVLP